MIVINHQLFSHAYLQKLGADASNDAAAAPILQGLRDWLPSRDSSSHAALVSTWIGPVLDFFGLHHSPAEGAPYIHLLYARHGDAAPIGLCYIVPPGQDLDEATKGRHPMAQAALALRARGLRWGMLTDGTHWRLLDSAALQRYENYLEINVDDLARNSDLGALRLFHKFFHRTAFQPSSRQDRERAGSKALAPHGEEALTVGLDLHAAGSERATKAAEDHLKARVSHNEGILAQLCLGLVRADGRSRYTEADRDSIYRDATYLLYRILFLLHAEARGLLPLDNPTYEAVSLSALVKTAYQYHINGMPNPEDTTLWDRLKGLCTAICESDPSLDIPAYNGGLFDDGDKPHLRTGCVADMHLTPALYDMAFMPDAHGTNGHRPIDYRDLSVRHLGSLYEGMIEYRLQIAEETLWARRDGKGNVLYLRGGQDGAPRRTDAEIKPGEVYFSQSPGERRATGTYYTPEYIVDYIVGQTVVRGLEERRMPLEQRLAGWRAEMATASDPAEQARMQRTTDDELLRFVEEQVLTFRVCDPAMGSGHFLVNAAHQITDFIVETLHLTRWEGSALQVDPVAWRRRVVEHCVFGVDLSLMAVELAKLSLWLASVAQDRPLSFLDHHLRQGNSLIGARIEDVAGVLGTPAAPSRKELRERAGGQLSMLEDPAFRQHIATASDLMAHIAARVADTVADVKAQVADYDQVRRELEPYHRLADLWTARYFGLDLDLPHLSDLSKHLLKGTAGLAPQYERLLENAQGLAASQHFLHWPLEFPDVFLRTGTSLSAGQAGFNAVVGNPPYVRQERISEQKAFFQAAFAEVYSGIADLYVFFIFQGTRRLAAGGRLGFIVANKWLRADYAAPLRAYLPLHTRPEQLLDFGHSDVFPGTDTFPCILIVKADGGVESGSLLYADVSDRVRGSTLLPEYVKQHRFEVPYLNLRRDGWALEPPRESDLLRKLQTQYPTLSDQLEDAVLRGVLTGLNEAFYIDTPTRDRLVDADAGCEPLLRKLLRGRNIRRWRPVWDGEWMIAIPSSGNRTWPWSGCENDSAAEEAFQATYPAIHAHLKPFEDALRRRQDKGRFWWELRACDYYDALDKPKIVAKRILFHSSFCVDEESRWANDSTVFLPSKDLYLLALLNSRIMWWYMYRLWPHMKDEAIRVQNEKWQSVPVPVVSPAKRAQVEALVQQALLSEEARPALEIEQQIHKCVVEAYGLTPAEVALIDNTLPPRDPLVVLHRRLTKDDLA
jgi:hypothetical protein